MTLTNEYEQEMLARLTNDGLEVHEVIRDEETGAVEYRTQEIATSHYIMPAPQIALPPDFALALAQSLADALAGSVVPVIAAQQQQLAAQAELLAEVTETNRIMRTQIQQPLVKESK